MPPKTKPNPAQIKGRRRRARPKQPGVILAKSGNIGRKGGKAVWGSTWSVTFNLDPNLDAGSLADLVSDVVLQEHLQAVQAGVRSDSGAPQPSLDPKGQQGARAAKGERPNKRGFTGLTTKPFAENLERTPIKVRARSRRGGGVKASTKIQADPIHRGWLATEAGRKVRYLYAGGFVTKLVGKALLVWSGFAMLGTLKKPDKSGRKAKNTWAV